MKSWWMIAVLVLAVASAFLLFEDSNSVNLAPRTYKPGLPDLTINISVTNVVNNSVNGSVQFLVNYTTTYKNIGNVASTNVTGMSGSSMQCAGGGSSGSGAFPIPALSPNQAITNRFYQIVDCQGLLNLFGVVDTTNVLTELNENNNNATISIPI